MFDNFTLENSDEQGFKATEILKTATSDDVDVMDVVSKAAKTKQTGKATTTGHNKHAEKLAVHLQVALEQAKQEEGEFAARIQVLEAEHAEAKAYVQYLQDTIKNL